MKMKHLALMYLVMKVPGLQSSLSFDIVKVNSGKLEDMEGVDVIQVDAHVEEKTVATLILRRKATSEKLKLCSNCTQKKACQITCEKCHQISYCSEKCKEQDQGRHRMFCSLTLRDMI